MPDNNGHLKEKTMDRQGNGHDIVIPGLSLWTGGGNKLVNHNTKRALSDENDGEHQPKRARSTEGESELARAKQKYLNLKRARLGDGEEILSKRVRLTEDDPKQFQETSENVQQPLEDDEENSTKSSSIEFILQRKEDPLNPKPDIKYAMRPKRDPIAEMMTHVKTVNRMSASQYQGLIHKDAKEKNRFDKSMAAANRRWEKAQHDAKAQVEHTRKRMEAERKAKEKQAREKDAKENKQ